MPICPECKLFLLLECPRHGEENEELIVCESFDPEEPMSEESKASLEEILDLIDAKAVTMDGKIIRGKNDKR